MVLEKLIVVVTEYLKMLILLLLHKNKLTNLDPSPNKKHTLNGEGVEEGERI